MEQISSAAAVMEVSDVMSSVMGSIVRPWERRVEAAVWPAAGLREARRMWWLCGGEARARERARPMPWFAPVMRVMGFADGGVGGALLVVSVLGIVW